MVPNSACGSTCQPPCMQSDIPPLLPPTTEFIWGLHVRLKECLKCAVLSVQELQAPDMDAGIKAGTKFYGHGMSSPVSALNGDAVS